MNMQCHRRPFLCTFLIGLLTLATIQNASAGLTLAAYNIRNFNYDDRSKVPTDEPVLATLIKETKADVISVEEIVNADAFKKFIASTPSLNKYSVVLTQCGGENRQKLGILYDSTRFNLKAFIEDKRTVMSDGRERMANKQDVQVADACNTGSRPLALSWLQDKVTNTEFMIISVHLKAGGGAKNVAKRQAQLNMIKNVMNEYQQKGVKSFAIMGDFNSTEYLDRGADYTALQSLAQSMNMTDFSKDLECTAYWSNPQSGDIQLPSVLDHIIVSSTLTSQYAHQQTIAGGHCAKSGCSRQTSEELGTSYLGVSDHCPISAVME